MEVTIQIQGSQPAAVATAKSVPVNLRSSSATCDDLVKQICADGTFSQACIKNPTDFELLVNGTPMKAGTPLEHGMVINLVVVKPKAAGGMQDWTPGAATSSTVTAATAAGNRKPKAALVHQLAPAPQLAPAQQLAPAPKLARALQLAPARARPAAPAESKQQAASLAKAPALGPALHALAMAPAPRIFEPRIITRKRQQEEQLYERLGTRQIHVGVRIHTIEERGPEGQEKWETIKTSTYDNRKTVTRKEETKKEQISTDSIKECRCVCFHPYYGPIMDRVTVGYKYTYHHYKRQVLTVDGVAHCGDWEFVRQDTETKYN